MLGAQQKRYIVRQTSAVGGGLQVLRPKPGVLRQPRDHPGPISSSSLVCVRACACGGGQSRCTAIRTGWRPIRTSVLPGVIATRARASVVNRA